MPSPCMDHYRDHPKDPTLKRTTTNPVTIRPLDHEDVAYLMQLVDDDYLALQELHGDDWQGDGALRATHVSEWLDDLSRAVTVTPYLDDPEDHDCDWAVCAFGYDEDHEPTTPGGHVEQCVLCGTYRTVETRRYHVAWTTTDGGYEGLGGDACDIVPEGSWGDMTTPNRGVVIGEIQGSTWVDATSPDEAAHRVANRALYAIDIELVEEA